MPSYAAPVKAMASTSQWVPCCSLVSRRTVEQRALANKTKGIRSTGEIRASSVLIFAQRGFEPDTWVVWERGNSPLVQRENGCWFETVLSLVVEIRWV